VTLKRAVSANLNPPKPALSRNDGGFVFRRRPSAANPDWSGFQVRPGIETDPFRAGSWADGLGEYPDSVAVVSDRTAELEIYPEGSFIKAKRAPTYCVQSANKPKVHRRGVVAGFSRKSQCRLMQNISQIKRSHLPVLITLTYPGEYPINPLIWKRDMDTFSKRFERRFPNAGFIWKLEPQRRGAPHFHLLAWDAELLPGELYRAVLPWLKSAWYEVVGSGDQRHLWSGTRVEVARSYGAVAKYACKYIAKMAQLDGAWGNPGRWWGVTGRANIPYADRLSVWLETGQASDLIRWIDRFRRRDKNRLRRRDTMSRWAMVENPLTWLDNLDRMTAIKNSVDLLAAKNFA
jgi:hypothetical protein